MKKRLLVIILGSALFAGMALAGGATSASAQGRADDTITITCTDFLGTFTQIVDKSAQSGITNANSKYNDANSDPDDGRGIPGGATCSCTP